MESNYSEEYKEKQVSGTLQKKYLERSYKIARSMFDPLPPKNSSLFHPRKHDNDKIEIEITTIRPNSRSFSQSNQYSQSVSRSPNSPLKTSFNNFSYSKSNSINKSPNSSSFRKTQNKNNSQSQESHIQPKPRSYYQFLGEYSSSFMNSNSSSPSNSPRYYKYGNGLNSYYYTELEPRVSKHFSPSKYPSSPIIPNFPKLHTSPPPHYNHQFVNDNDSSYFQGSNIQSKSLIIDGERKNVGIQRTDTCKYQYEEESFKNVKIEEEEEDNNDDIDIESSFKKTASTISDVLNDEQLAKDRELLRKNTGIDFRHKKWNGEAEPNPEIDDTKLDQRVSMIISKLKEQNSLSAQNSQLNESNRNENANNSDDDADDIIFLNDDIDNNDMKNQDPSKKPNFNEENALISKQNIENIYSNESSLPQNLIGTQIDFAYEAADKITHDTNQKIINLNNK